MDTVAPVAAGKLLTAGLFCVCVALFAVTDVSEGSYSGLVFIAWRKHFLAISAFLRAFINFELLAIHIQMIRNSFTQFALLSFAVGADETIISIMLGHTSCDLCPSFCSLGGFS